LEPTAPRRSLAAKLRRRPMRRKRRRLEVVGTLSPLPIFVRLRSKKEPLFRAARAWAGVNFPKSFYIHYRAMIISGLPTIHPEHHKASCSGLNASLACSQ
jgi:hypothetical protein